VDALPQFDLYTLKTILHSQKGMLRGPESRESFEQVLAQFPPTDGVDFEDVIIGGRNAVRCVPEGSNPHSIILYLHGGGYVAGSAHGYRHLCARLAKLVGAPAFVLEYRLAPEHRFPAALDDAVAAYRSLIETGTEPKSIVIIGDSAGGGLTVATLVALRDASLPLPAGAALISPWTDLEGTGASVVEKADADPILAADTIPSMAAYYLGDQSPRLPLASPIHADLTGLPPLLIQVGEDEILLDDARRLAEHAKAAGVDVSLRIWPGLFHVWHLTAGVLREGEEGIAEAAGFLRDILAMHARSAVT
jgi:acetyl esterase/lipase